MEDVIVRCGKEEKENNILVVSKLLETKEKATKKYFIGSWNEAETFVKDNEYIQTGYRINFNSVKLILKSLFMIHNETFNVWSHIIGSILVILLIVYVAIHLVPNQTFPTISVIQNTIFSGKNINIEKDNVGYYYLIKNTILENLNQIKLSVIASLNELNLLANFDKQIENLEYAPDKIKEMIYSLVGQKINARLYDKEIIITFLPKWPLYLHFFGALICLSFSFIFHLFSSYNYQVSNILNKLDYAGVIFLITGSTFPANIYGYMCDQLASNIFVYSICFLSILVFVIIMHPKSNQPYFRRIRGTLFILLGLSAGSPAYYALFADKSLIAVDPLFWALGGATYVLGGVIYVLRIPERWFPKKFDIFGGSHNVLHTFVLLGAFFHFIASLQSYHLRKLIPCYIP